MRIGCITSCKRPTENKLSHLFNISLFHNVMSRFFLYKKLTLFFFYYIVFSLFMLEVLCIFMLSLSDFMEFLTGQMSGLQFLSLVLGSSPSVYFAPFWFISFCFIFLFYYKRESVGSWVNGIVKRIWKDLREEKQRR